MEPFGFVGELKPYQKLALTWMLCREDVLPQRGREIFELEGWEDLSEKLKLEKPLYFNKTYNVFLSQKPFKVCNGGIIGDEMGLGKTVMMIALMLAHRPKQRKLTVVITPASIIDQW